jgi:ubiquitin C-terminal hydrolase
MADSGQESYRDIVAKKEQSILEHASELIKPVHGQNADQIVADNDENLSNTSIESEKNEKQKDSKINKTYELMQKTRDELYEYLEKKLNGVSDEEIQKLKKENLNKLLYEYLHLCYIIESQKTNELEIDNDNKFIEKFEKYVKKQINEKNKIVSLLNLDINDYPYQDDKDDDHKKIYLMNMMNFFIDKYIILIHFKNFKNIQKYEINSIKKLPNIGNSCYMNAVLQMLVRIPEFNYVIFRLNETYTRKNKKQKFIQIYKAFYDEYKSKDNIMSIEILKNIIDSDNLIKFKNNQNAVDDFLQEIFNVLNDQNIKNIFLIQNITTLSANTDSIDLSKVLNNSSDDHKKYTYNNTSDNSNFDYILKLVNTEAEANDIFNLENIFSNNIDFVEDQNISLIDKILINTNDTNKKIKIELKKKKVDIDGFEIYLENYVVNELDNNNKIINSYDLSNQQTIEIVAEKTSSFNTYGSVLLIYANPMIFGKKIHSIKQFIIPKVLTKKQDENDDTYILQGIICHKGSTTESGHYVYFHKNQNDNLNMFDDDKSIELDKIIKREEKYTFQYNGKEDLYSPTMFYYRLNKS